MEKLTINEDEEEHLFPNEHRPEQDKKLTQEEIKELQDKFDETGELLPTELNGFPNQRKYAPENGDDENVLLPYTE